MIFPFADPTKCRITYPYGVKNSRYASGKHDGIDIVCDCSDKTILSISDGVVIKSSSKGAWGEHIVVKTSSEFYPVYAHMVKGSRMVSVGDKVVTGQALGIMGNTSTQKLAPHLHLEIQKNYYEAGNVFDVAEFLGIENIKSKTTGDIKFLEAEECELRYNKVSEIPIYAQETINKLIKKGIISGSDGKLDLSLDMIRLLIFNDRAGLYK